MTIEPVQKGVFYRPTSRPRRVGKESQLVCRATTRQLPAPITRLAGPVFVGGHVVKAQPIFVNGTTYFGVGFPAQLVCSPKATDFPKTLVFVDAPPGLAALGSRHASPPLFNFLNEFHPRCERGRRPHPYVQRCSNLASQLARTEHFCLAGFAVSAPINPGVFLEDIGICFDVFSGVFGVDKHSKRPTPLPWCGSFPDRVFDLAVFKVRGDEPISPRRHQPPRWAFKDHLVTNSVGWSGH